MRRMPAIGVVLTACVLLAIPSGRAAEAPAAPTETKTLADKPQPPADPNTLAVIGEYQISRDEVVRRYMELIGPYDGLDVERARALTVRDVVLELVAEKAMTLDARKAGALNDEMIRTAMTDFRGRRLVNLLIGDYIQGKVSVTEEEVQAAMKANPRLDETAARVTLQSAKSRQVMDMYYQQVYERVKVKKITENFPKAARIHMRLLLQPKIERAMQFVMVRQVQEELTQAEKDMVLATFEGGKFTLLDMFNALTNIAPPRRPEDLNTPEGIEQFVDQGLRLPVLVVEAEAKGYDKNPELLTQIKQQEDMRLLGKAKMDMYQAVAEPNDGQIDAYFAAHKDEFRLGEKVKIDQIWLDTRAAADAARTHIDAGKDFEQVKQRDSINKDSKPFDTYRSAEGIFGEPIFAADPNTVVGPIKGLFSGNSVKWRIVKVLDKDAGDPPTLDDQTRNRVKWKLWADRRLRAFDRVKADLLSRYDYTLYEDRLAAIRPLDLP